MSKGKMSKSEPEKYFIKKKGGACLEPCKVIGGNVKIGSMSCQTCRFCKGCGGDSWEITWIKCERIKEATTK